MFVYTILFGTRQCVHGPSVCSVTYCGHRSSIFLPFFLLYEKNEGFSMLYMTIDMIEWGALHLYLQTEPYCHTLSIQMRIDCQKEKDCRSMRLHTATLVAHKNVLPDVYLLDLYAPQLAQAVLPGQYCMVRCCPPAAADPLLRRPFYIHSVQRTQGLCRLLVHVRGRGTAWLVQQPEGSVLEVLGPLGHGWSIHPTTRNLLLVNEGAFISALPLLAQVALEQELVVTLLSKTDTMYEAYPPMLFSQEVEYHIVTTDGSSGQQGDLQQVLSPYLTWADAVCCSVSRETALTLYNHFEPLRKKNFAQCAYIQPLVCGSGACFACSIETRSGQKLVCRDGPIFDLRELVR